MDAGSRKALKSLARTRTRAEMKALFETIRTENDAALLAAAPRCVRRTCSSDERCAALCRSR
jgi:hypothetical protein